MFFKKKDSKQNKSNKKTKQKKNNKKRKTQSNFNKFIKKILFISNEPLEGISLKRQIFTMIYFTAIGFILCLIVLYAISGGKNYLKLYSELNKFIDTYDTITSNYYGDLSKEQLIDNAISSMLASIGDSYTTYSDIDSTNDFNESIEGTYEGIGCTVTTDENGNILVASIFEDGPAAEAGLKENDIIIKINGEDYTQKTSSDVAEYVKNSTNSTIKITIIRDNKEKELTIKRSKIEVPTVTSKTFDQNDTKIGYINISIFSSVTTKQFEEELDKLEDDNIEALIIDVRDNNGGYLSSVTDIASMFLTKNKIIYQLQNEDETEKIKDTTNEHREYPITVLINKNSASASEILASAIQESYGGEVVGVNSYGKGTVQKTKTLSDGSMIKYTIEKWLTPTGKWIDEKGVTPTQYVELDLTIDYDNQLQTALEITQSKIVE